MRTERAFALDISRLFAAILVVIYHAFPQQVTQTGLLEPLLLSVDYFFVLSGFVLAPTLTAITSPLVLTHWLKWRLRRFYLPLLPVLLTMGIQMVWSPWTDALTSPVDFLLASLLMQVFSETATQLNVPLWSLSAEVIANLTAAIIICVAGVRRSTTPLLVMGLFLLHVGGEVGGLEYGGYTAVGRSITGFALGLSAYQWKDKMPSCVTAKRAQLALLTSSILISMGQFYFFRFQFIAFVDLAFALLVIGLWRLRSNAVRSNVAWGAVSYEIYIWHGSWLSLALVSLRFAELDSHSFVTRFLCLGAALLMSIASGSIWRWLLNRVISRSRK